MALSDSPRVTQLEDQFLMRFYLEEAAETNLWTALFLPHFAKLRISGAAAQLKNSAKTVKNSRNAESKQGDAAPQHPPRLDVMFTKQKSTCEEYTPVHLELIKLCIYANPAFVAALECSMH